MAHLVILAQVTKLHKIGGLSEHAPDRGRTLRQKAIVLKQENKVLKEALVDMSEIVHAQARTIERQQLRLAQGAGPCVEAEAWRRFQ